MDSTTNRHELQQLCAGMRFVQLSFASDRDLGVASELLRAFDPLKQAKAASKKSHVQHLLCDMLAAILRPAAHAGEGGGAEQTARVHSRAEGSDAAAE